jgi:hypothetical protein
VSARSSHRRLLKPLTPLAHTHLGAVVKVEVNLVHELFYKENAPPVIGQEVLSSGWIGNFAWIESQA